MGPSRHLLFLELSIPLLKHRAELHHIALDFDEVLIGDLLPFLLKRASELIPELAELFVIHEELLRYEVADQTTSARQLTHKGVHARCRKRLLWRKSGGDRGIKRARKIGVRER